MSAPEAQPSEGAAEFYDDMWQRYGHLDAASPAAFHRRRLIVELSAKHAPSATQVLDAGCGRGELVRALRLAFPSATLCGSDVSLASVKETQRLEPSLEVLQMDLQEPRFDEAYRAHLGRFGLVTCSEVVEHLSNDRRAVQRLSRLLAPGGVLVLTVPGGKMSRFDELIGHLGAGIDEEVAAGQLEEDAAPRPPVAGVGRAADLAVAPEDGDAGRCPRAQERQASMRAQAGFRRQGRAPPLCESSGSGDRIEILRKDAFPRDGSPREILSAGSDNPLGRASRGLGH